MMTELKITDALKLGVEAHRAGKVQEADRYYTAILKVQPNHPDANHNLGLIAVSVNKIEQAIPLLKTALETNPKIPQFWISFIDALLKGNQINAAQNALIQAKEHGIDEQSVQKFQTQLTELNNRTSKEDKPDPDEIKNLIDLHRNGENKKAIKKAEQMVALFPKSALLFNIFGACHFSEKNYDAAIENYKKAINLRPDYADAHNDLGRVYAFLNDWKTSINYYDKAISINDRNSQYHLNRGNALNEQGLIEAIYSYKKVLNLDPKNFHALNNLGLAYTNIGENDSALENFKLAIKINPTYSMAYFNMGQLYQKLDKTQDALYCFYKAAELDRSLAPALYAFGNVLGSFAFSELKAEFKNLISRLLSEENYVNPGNISKNTVTLLKAEPDIKKILKTVNQSFDLNLVVDIIGKNLLLLDLLKSCPIPDIEIENVLKKIRRELLLNYKQSLSNKNSLFLIEALAIQCFINEYLYSETPDELILIDQMEKRLQALLKNNQQPNIEHILLFSCYRPLSNYSWSAKIKLTGQFPDFELRLLSEPRRQAKIINKIPEFKNISDSVSKKVRAQYEESPYPRWVKCRLIKEPKSISVICQKLSLSVTDKSIFNIKTPKILVAGCGTGQHSIQTADRFKDCKVTAIDLSLSSLSYAKMRSDELNFSNIDYLHADILDTKLFEKKFDIIESGGVLHHMKDPMEGWEALTNTLRPGGLMKIGLYSKHARKIIIDQRNRLGLHKKKIHKEMILIERENIIRSDNNFASTVRKWNDFYSLSEMRDLLYHVQEHQFTLPQIKECLSTLNLSFCGFENQALNSIFFKILSTSK